MGQARDVMDEMTAAAFSKNPDTAAKLYAADVIAVTPDQGEIRGREQVMRYLTQTLDAFPDARYEPLAAYESGVVAIDEGFFVGTNTGTLATPDGEVPATGKRVRVRSVDIATVKNGEITEHRFYFDQTEFLGQLGLLPEDKG